LPITNKAKKAKSTNIIIKLLELPASDPVTPNLPPWKPPELAPSGIPEPKPPEWVKVWLPVEVDED
jgi:hypothetical protein